jgi:4'-phosphopantetheinyl transferase
MVGADSISVWMVAVDTVPETLWPRLDGLLVTAERKRAARFLFDRHLRQYKAAHALKRLMLTSAVGGVVAPGSWAFETDARGKPRVADGAGLQFNLSHTRGLVACAVSWQVELGVDVENLDRRAPLELAGTYFAPAEQAWLRGLPTAARPRGFFQLWTLKEAYIKATGLGLAQPLEAFAFGFDPLHVTFADPALGDPAAWRFYQRPVGTRHVLALAWRADVAVVPVETAVVRFEALLEADPKRI